MRSCIELLTKVVSTLLDYLLLNMVKSEVFTKLALTVFTRFWYQYLYYDLACLKLAVDIVRCKNQFPVSTPSF